MSTGNSNFAIVPVTLRFPEEMAADISAVLGGEYEAGYDGEDLTILDVGANVGAFTIWANMRWPNSRIHAYEPNPGTFPMLLENVGSLANVTCHQAAVFPGEQRQRMLYSQFPGDGEAGLVDYIGTTFADLQHDRMIPVATMDPHELPACDVLKIDVEGGEAAILNSMDLSGVSLILLEYQDMRNRRSIERRLEDEFICEFSDCEPWRPILPMAGYRAELADDSYGRMFYANKRTRRLRRSTSGRVASISNRPVDPTRLSLRDVLNALPGAARRALASRLR